MKIFYGSIRKKLIILVLIAIMPVLLVLLGTELVYRQQAIKIAEKDLATYLHSFVVIQERITDSTRTLLRTVASIPAIQDCNVDEARIILSTLLETNPIYSNVILVDINGDVVASGKDHDNSIGLNFSDRKQFKDAISSKGFSSGEFAVGKSSHTAIFPFGIAVLDENAQPKGALIIGVKLDHYGNLFKKGNSLNNHFFGLCDHKGLRLYRLPSTDASSIGKPIKNDVYQSATTSNQAGSILTVSSDNLKRIIVYEPVRFEENSKPYMYMFMGLDYSQIQNQANVALIRSATTGLITLALAITIAWFIGGRGIANRMEKLTKATKKFSHGERNVTSNIDYKDGEVGVLAESFDTMVSMLREQEYEKDVILEQLGTSEKRFREIFEDVSEIAIQGYDEHRTVTFWNSASEKLYQYTKEEAIGKKLEDLIIPDHLRDTVIQLHAHWLETGEKIPAEEVILIDKNGNDVPVFSSHIISDTLYGKELFCIDVDMRPLKKSEAEREQLLSQLKQSQKMEAIGTLAGGIAHDFNNILVPILGYSNMLQSETNDEFINDSLKQISTSAMRAKDLVQQILTFSRNETTRYQSIHIQTVLAEVLKLLRSTIPQNITISHNIDQNCRAVDGDSTQIHQVIMNLATNSFHAMKEDGGELCFNLSEEVVSKNNLRETRLTNGPAVCLTITDTGTGISEEMMDKIFDPFFTTKEKGKGTGMGLSVVHGIIENMGGYVSVTSEEGSGTIVKVFLPISTSNIPTSKPAQPITKSLTGSEHVLVVDDEESVLKMTSTSLQKNGYTVTAMNNPIEALAHFRNSPNSFSLMISDVSMPGMTGDKLTKEILKIQPDLSVILCTGYNEKITPVSAENLGVSAIIMKPFLPSELVKKVREILDQTKSV